MSLLTNQDLFLRAFGTHSTALIHGVTNQRELRLGLTDNTRNNLARVNSNLDG